MNDHPGLICAAGNIVVPCCLALEGKGYILDVIRRGQENETWCAQKDGRRFQSDNPVELLGLVTMVELRGPDWQASDSDIDAFLGRYGGQAP